MLQILYRECSPSDWSSVSDRAPAVLALVLTKENWMMHHKFPCVALLCCFYSLLKSRVLLVHNLLCPEKASLIDQSFFFFFFFFFFFLFCKKSLVSGFAGWCYSE